MEIDKIYIGDCLEGMQMIPDKSIDMILCDPPYIGMVNEGWDRKTDAEALLFFNSMCQQAERILRFGGRIILFSSNDTLRFIYPSVDSTDNIIHRELITIDKGLQVAAGRNTRQYKQHVNIAEYVSVNTKFAHSFTKKSLLDAQNKTGLKAKEINDLLGVKSNGGGMWSIYTGDNICKQVPTESLWLRLSDIFPLLPPFASFQEVYHNGASKTNILSGFDFRINDRVHPTQKPMKLIEYLIKTYTNEGETVLDNCAGSGTTGIACINTKRNYILMEKEEKYYNVILERIKKHVRQGELFTQ